MTDRTLTYSATTVDVTPPSPVPLAGYAARGAARSTGTHDPLTASLVWLADEAGDSAVCWVALDALGLDAGTAERIRAAVGSAAGLAPDAVLVCCSHTHAGPAAWCRPGPGPSPWGPADDAAIDRLVRDLARGAARLRDTRCAVGAGWASVPNAGVGGNRYDPGGPHDPSLGALTLRDGCGAVVAVLFDYACHPTVLGHANREFSADFPGAARRVAAAALAETEGVETPPVLAFLQGAAGDASTRFTRRATDFGEVARQGGILAGAVLGAVLAGSADPVAGAVPVVRRTTVTVPTRDLPAASAAKRTLAAARSAWRRVPAAEHDTPAARIARTRYEGAQALAVLREAGLPAAVELPVTVVALGDVAWVHLPVEPFASWGTAIRAASPFPVTRVVGYTDGYFGYLADPPAHELGHYEALSSMFDGSAGELVVAAAAALLHGSR